MFDVQSINKLITVTSEIFRKSFNQKDRPDGNVWIYAKNLRALGPINVNNKTESLFEVHLKDNGGASN